MVYDINDASSFKQLINWESEMKINGVEPGKLKVVLMGNKVEINSRVNSNRRLLRMTHQNGQEIEGIIFMKYQQIMDQK